MIEYTLKGITQKDKNTMFNSLHTNALIIPVYTEAGLNYF